MRFSSKGMLLASALFSSAALADRTALYEITVTNITPGQNLTPILVVAHRRSQSLFTPGQPASESLAMLAEGGDTGPLTQDLEDAGVPANQIATIFGPDPATLPPLTTPGDSASIRIAGPKHGGRLSIAAMLVPTNDTFAALNAVRLPFFGQASYAAVAYDAGTEANDQNCANMPGPPCDGIPYLPAAGTDEGFVHVSNGFHDLGDFDADGNVILGPQGYDWRNPVARVVVRRIR